MAQHDYVISNQSLAAGRADLNNALAAIVSQNSGPNQPNPTFAYQLWADTTAGQLKIRNAANNAWIVVGSLADVGLGLLSRAGGTMTGALLQAAGTAALPGVAVAGDPDTGWFGKAANQLGVSTDGVERGYFDSLGWNGPVVGAVTTPSLNGGPLAGLRNLLINANPLINQRGYVSGTATTGANQYTLDRWRVVTSGQSISWTDSANIRTVTAPAGGVEQVIEGINILSGTYALSWTGTATATVNGSAVAKGGTVTLTGGANCTVQFRSGTFALPQLEPGTTATPFESRSCGLELALCQRYYAEVDAEYRFDAALGTSSATVGHMWYTPVVMRSGPTVTVKGESSSNSGNIFGITVKSSQGAMAYWEWTNGNTIAVRNKAAILRFAIEL